MQKNIENAKESAQVLETIMAKGAKANPCQCGFEHLYDELTDEELNGAIKAASLQYALFFNHDKFSAAYFGMLQHLLYNRLLREKSILEAEEIC